MQQVIRSDENSVQKSLFFAAPLFVVQWLFDEEQLRVENIYVGGQSLSEQQWTYMQNLGKELKNSLKDVT